MAYFWDVFLFCSTTEKDFTLGREKQGRTFLDLGRDEEQNERKNFYFW